MTTPFDLDVNHVKENRDQYILVDVREPYELQGPEGYIEGAILATLGQALTLYLESANPNLKYVFICRSGVRSGKACEFARAQGLVAYNMKGGMIGWQAL